MSRKDDAQVVREVTESIDRAVHQLRRTERLVLITLVALFLVGLGLLVYGAMSQVWQILIPGGLIQLTILFPIRRLIRLREDEMRLRILPQLLRLADSKESKLLAAELVTRLIEQVGSDERSSPPSAR